MKYHHEWLLKHQQDRRIRIIFFWSHEAPRDGSISKNCFSQWWKAAFIVDGLEYKTAEHWMMAGKARLFNDEIALRKILAVKTAAEAKKLGREVFNFVPSIWEEQKYPLVVQGNLYKFSAHPALSTFLLSTGEHIIAEASPADNVWGIGLAADHPDAGYPEKWKGENLLGYALMEVRDLLKQDNQEHSTQ